MPDEPERQQNNRTGEQEQGNVQYDDHGQRHERNENQELIEPIDDTQQKARSTTEMQQYMDKYAPEPKAANPEVTRWNMSFIEN